MTPRRGRVAITMLSLPHEGDSITVTAGVAQFKTPRPRIHLGHARTLLLGEAYCRERGIPFHVRLEAEWAKVRDFHTGLIDLMGLLAWFGVRADLVYRMPMKPRPEWVYARMMGAEAWARVKAAHATWEAAGSGWLDFVLEDLADWWPSLMIRGREFEDVGDYDPDWPAAAGDCGSIARIVRYEHDLYAAAGRERLQLSLPIVADPHGSKMSKSLGGIGWDVLQAVSPEQARRYLWATAASPLDPMAGLDAPLNLENLDPTPHVWSWQQWGSYVRSL